MSRRALEENLTHHGDPEFTRYMRRAFLASAGYDGADLSRPLIGIADTSSDLNPCHRPMPELVAAVKRGVLEAGGLPMVFPTSSWNELLTSPTTMLYRNLLAMETEELLRSQPVDAVVLVAGCDKTVPAQLMAAASADIPALQVVVGAARAGSWRGQRLTACTDCRRLWAGFRRGELRAEELPEVERALVGGGGTCMVMGTASTLACLSEGLGMMLPGGACPPAGTGDRLRHAAASGRRAVGLAEKGRPRPRELLSAGAFQNALRLLVALGGSTNAVVHLFALARRVGVALGLEDLDAAGREVPLLVDCKPTGGGTMEELHAAGGVGVLMKAMEGLLDLDARSVAGGTLRERLSEVKPPAEWQRTVRTLRAPFGPPGSLRVLRGSLAPSGAVIKAAAASPGLLRHRGPALVFESPEDAAARMDDPSLQVTPDHVLVLRGAGPVGAGMPEAGAIAIPRRLAAAGVKDMVRVSDARMSGTAFGTVVLHCAPESAVGGPLALVRDGDLIELDVPAGRLELYVDEAELARRRSTWRPPPLPVRGWPRLHAQHVLQADEGADLDFLV